MDSLFSAINARRASILIMTHHCTINMIVTHRPRKDHNDDVSREFHRISIDLIIYSSHKNVEMIHLRDLLKGEDMNQMKIKNMSWNTNMFSLVLETEKFESNVDLMVKDFQQIFCWCVDERRIVFVRSTRSHLVSTSIWSLINRKNDWFISCICQFDCAIHSQHDLMTYSRCTTTWIFLDSNW